MATDATTNPVLAWDERVLAVLETNFGSTPNPAASQYVQFYDLDLGPEEQQQVRIVKDKQIGRGETAAFVSGRIMPIKFKGKTSVKTRAAVDTVPVEDALYQASGLLQTVNSGTSVVYTPITGSSPKSLSVYRSLGASPNTLRAEQGRGGVVSELNFSGGDKEVLADISGEFIGKYSLGRAQATVADGVTTTVSVDQSGDEYGLQPGYYSWENEIILIQTIQYGSGTFTCLRAQLASSGVAHSGKSVYPYTPSISAPTYSPISEANCTVSIDGVTTLVKGWTFNLKTGMALLPGESGSAYIQGHKAVRYSVKTQVEMVWKDNSAILVGKMNSRKNVAVTLTQGTGTGGIWSVSLPTCVIEPFDVPAPNNDIAMVKVGFHPRDSSGNDMFSITLT